MSAMFKRRWFQFSLKSLLFVVTLVAIGSAWWNHRSFCLEQCRIHADRNAACTSKVYGTRSERDMATVEGAVTWGNHGTGFPDGSTFILWVSPTESGYRRWRLELGGQPPIEEQKLQAEMEHEADLADRYFHALWRPWERLWIEDRQTATPPTP